MDLSSPATLPADAIAAPAREGEASLARRAAIRFGCLYFVLYLFPEPVAGLVVGTQWLEDWVNAGWTRLSVWVGMQALSLPRDFAVPDNGSGDRTVVWVQLLCQLAIALALTAASFAPRALRRAEERKWVALARLWVRYALAGILLHYGLAKVLKAQFPTPGPHRLLETYGESSPHGLLWAFMGYSTLYTIFSGLAEVVPGLLLFFRRTTLLGALLGAAVMTNVVLLNLCYDVPVKIFSAHLLVFCAFLAAPGARRVWAALLGRAAEAAPEEWPRPGRAARVAALLFALAIVGSRLYESSKAYFSWGDGHPQPQIAGLWEVEEHRRDGQPLPLNDLRRWRRVGLDWRGVTIRVADDSRVQLVLRPPLSPRELSLAGPIAGGATKLQVDASDPERPILRGPWEGWQIEVRLRRADPSRTLLLDRGFHWINETSFNR